MHRALCQKRDAGFLCCRDETGNLVALRRVNQRADVEISIMRAGDQL